MSNRFFSCPGSRKRKIYEPAFDDNGSRFLKLVGEEDIADYIQSFYDSCDIQTILKRFQLGDTSALSQTPGMYGNFINVPHTLAEFLNAQIKANQLFDNLPSDVRASFNNDANQFFVKMGTPEFNDIVSRFTSVSTSVSEKENLNNES